MKIGITQLEHQSDIVSRMSDELAKRFFKYAKMNEEESISNTLIDLSKSIGYLTIVNNSVEKTFKQEKRLKLLENKMSNMPINMTMFEEAPLEKYR